MAQYGYMGMEGKKRIIARAAEAEDLVESERNEKAKIETPSIGSIHFYDLHDEDADRAGQKIDEATGKALLAHNSADVGHDDVLSTTVNPEDADPETGDIMGRVNDGTDNDAAARWLREHGADAR